MSFAQANSRTARAALPLAPMLDVMFILLIFFVTTWNLRQEEQHIQVALATARTGTTAPARRTELIVNVKADGAILVGSIVHSPSQLASMLRDLVRDYPEERVVIRGDKQVPYERIVAVIDLARAAGVAHVTLATVKDAQEIGR
jgi:biopolymer transport protein ExbD